MFLLELFSVPMQVLRQLQLTTGVVTGWGSADVRGECERKGAKVKKTGIIFLSPFKKRMTMIVASIEQICPAQPEWLEQCELLRGAQKLPEMVWIVLQMGLWLARGILEAELKQRARAAGEWGKCKECGHKMQSKGWRKRQIETIVGTIH